MALGEVVVVKCDAPAQLRHRRVLRALVAHVGANITLQMKNGRDLRGPLVAFDRESEIGTLGDHVFVAGQVRAVQATPP